MGLDARFTNDLEQTNVTIEPVQHRRLGMHLVEYAQRHQINDVELGDMLAMIGLAEQPAD